MKRKAIKQAMKTRQRKADEVHDTLLEIINARETRRLPDEITELFDEVEGVHKDLTTIYPEDEHVIDHVCKEHRQLRRHKPEFERNRPGRLKVHV